MKAITLLLSSLFSLIDSKPLVLHVPEAKKVRGENTIARNAVGASGKATYYTEWNKNPGSCGFIPPFSNLVALAPSFMPDACGKCILIHYKGFNVKAVVTDTCMACASNPKMVDLSDIQFGQFDDLSLGVLVVDWDFVPCTD